jgi:predicted CXXCH cytochrome family protein
LGAGALALAFLGCSIEKNYKTLSFFFDGVPDPNAPSRAAHPGVPSDISQSPTYSAHKPWLEEKCEECHTRTLKLGGRDSDLCMKCHSESLTSHEYMHGPVAVGACLWCHNPHNSANAHLLKLPGRDLCMQCHAQGLLSNLPAHSDLRRACLECHQGHGGPDRFFLRAGASR